MPGWTCELEAAVKEDIRLAPWLMSDRSPRVTVLQWHFLNDWHSSLTEETNSTENTGEGLGMGRSARGSGGCGSKECGFHTIRCLKEDRAWIQLSNFS